MEMSYSPQEQKKYKQVPVGTHTGICYLIADIGTQKTTYEGEEKNVHQIILGWETPDEKTDDGKPLSIIKTYTLSFNEKATLAKDYKAWVKDSAPSKFNLGALLGMGCNLNIGVTSGGNAKVTGVSALKAKEKVPNLVAEPVLFDMRNPSDDALSRLPGFIKDKIVASPEYQAHVLNRGKPIEETLNDAIGF
jgi:hypothetical protein